jgi:hypothetical protein
MDLKNAIPREAKMAIAEEMERTNESWRQTWELITASYSYGYSYGYS